MALECTTTLYVRRFTGAVGGRFATTIHVLVSGVVKLMRVARLPAGLVLYRGLGGTMALPDWFSRGDASGLRGYAEWGFLSTTSSRDVAIEVRRAVGCRGPLLGIGRADRFLCAYAGR